MADALAHVSPDDPLVISAEAWNLLTDAAREALRLAVATRVPRRVQGTAFTPATLVRFQNTTGSTLPDLAVLTPTGAVYDPATDSMSGRRAPEFTVAAPASADDPVILALESVENNKSGLAVVFGVTLATVVVSDAAHRFARPIAGNLFQLESAASGPARLLTPPGVGTAVTYVLLGSVTAATGGGTDDSDCTGCGWAGALADTDCLAVSLDGTRDIPVLGSSDGLTWTDGVHLLVICGTSYVVTFTTGDCDGPCLTLHTGGSGGTTFTGKRDCCGCNYVVFAFATATLCPDAEPADGGPCKNITRVRVDWTCCPRPGADGDGWYCVTAADGDCADATAMELIGPELCDADLKLCAGPFPTEEAAMLTCSGSGPVDAVCQGLDMSFYLMTFSNVTGGCSCLPGSAVGEFWPQTPAPQLDHGLWNNLCGFSGMDINLQCNESQSYTIQATWSDTGGAHSANGTIVGFSASPFALVADFSVSGGACNGTAGTFRVTVTPP